jgi:hypothetical protein
MFPVGHGGVVVRLRRVVRQGRIRSRRRGRIPLDSSYQEKAEKGNLRWESGR